jgi:hypothetical protein
MLFGPPSSRIAAGWPVLLHAALGGHGHSSHGHPKSPHLSDPGSCSCACSATSVPFTRSDLPRGSLQTQACGDCGQLVVAVSKVFCWGGGSSGRWAAFYSAAIVAPLVSPRVLQLCLQHHNAQSALSDRPSGSLRVAERTMQRYSSRNGGRQAGQSNHGPFMASAS